MLCFALLGKQTFSMMRNWMTTKKSNNVGDDDPWIDFGDMYGAFWMMNVISNVGTVILTIALTYISVDMMISNVNENETSYVHAFDMLMVSVVTLVDRSNAVVSLDFV